MSADPPRTVVPLTALTGVPVRDATGRRTGWVRDVVARVSARGAQVTGLVVGDLRGRWVVPWSDLDVSRLDHLTLTRAVARELRQSIPLETDELLLVRDMLDCRVYVASQRQTARVGEVWLEPSEQTTLSVAGVEVGLGVAMRRLGPRRQRSVPGMRLLRLDEVHLVSSRGHLVQLTTNTSPAQHLAPPDLAHLLTQLPSRLAVDVLRGVPTTRSKAAVEHLHPRVRSHLVRAEQGRRKPRRKPRRRFRRTTGLADDPGG
jgi:hypothetical protein